MRQTESNVYECVFLHAGLGIAQKKGHKKIKMKKPDHLISQVKLTIPFYNTFIRLWLEFEGKHTLL